jgi:hypothetical protein
VGQHDVGLRACGLVPRYDLCDINPAGAPDGNCNISDALRMGQCDVGLIPCDFSCAALICASPPGLGTPMGDGVPASSQAAPATVRIELDPQTPLAGELVTAQLVIDTADPIGAYSVSIACDGSALEILSPIRGGDAFEFSAPPIQNVAGCNASVSAFQALSLNSPTGSVVVANIDLQVSPEAAAGSASVLDLTVNTLTDTDGTSLVAVARDETVHVASACGNALLDVGESCDDGDVLWHAGEKCSGVCSLLACGDPDDSGTLTASDALFVLHTSVGIQTCDSCVCDVDSSGGAATVSDALRILRAAVQRPVEIVCPACQ